jgi:hypothetical protein
VVTPQLSQSSDPFGSLADAPDQPHVLSVMERRPPTLTDQPGLAAAEDDAAGSDHAEVEDEYHALLDCGCQWDISGSVQAHKV